MADIVLGMNTDIMEPLKKLVGDGSELIGRVVIDIPVDGIVRVYVEKFAGEKAVVDLLNAMVTGSPIEVERERRL